MHGASQRLLKNSLPGVLYEDLVACDKYQGAILAGKMVRCPSLFILGENDKMTPVRKVKELAEVIQCSEIKVIKDCGHMMMSERPNQVFKNLKRFI